MKCRRVDYLKSWSVEESISQSVEASKGQIRVELFYHDTWHPLVETRGIHQLRHVELILRIFGSVICTILSDTCHPSSCDMSTIWNIRLPHQILRINHPSGFTSRQSQTLEVPGPGSVGAPKESKSKLLNSKWLKDNLGLIKINMISTSRD